MHSLTLQDLLGSLEDKSPKSQINVLRNPALFTNFQIKSFDKNEPQIILMRLNIYMYENKRLI